MRPNDGAAGKLRAETPERLPPDPDEWSGAALRDLQDLFNKAFYDELKVQLEALNSRLNKMSLQALHIKKAIEELPTHSALEKGWQAIEEVMERQADALQRVLKASETAVAGTLQAEIHEVIARLNLIEARMVTCERFFQDDVMATAVRRLELQVAELKQTLLGALHSESAAYRDHRAAFESQLAETSTALTKYTDSQFSLVGRRIRSGAIAYTLLGWLLPAIVLVLLWLLRSGQ